MKRTITLQVCEITGKTTVKWIENLKCIHKYETETERQAKNVIKRYRKSGVLPIEGTKPVRIAPVVETTEETLRPVNFEYFHRRCQQPVYIAAKESEWWNGKLEVVLILKDAAGRVYRILQNLVKRYLDVYSPKMELA